MAGIFRRILISKIFTFLFYIVLTAMIGVYGYGIYHAYRHSTMMAFLSAFTIVPSFYYVYESQTVEHHPCAIPGCEHLATQSYDTYDGLLYICENDIEHYKRLKGQ